MATKRSRALDVSTFWQGAERTAAWEALWRRLMAEAIRDNVPCATKSIPGNGAAYEDKDAAQAKVIQAMKGT